MFFLFWFRLSYFHHYLFNTILIKIQNLKLIPKNWFQVFIGRQACLARNMPIDHKCGQLVSIPLCHMSAFFFSSFFVQLWYISFSFYCFTLLHFFFLVIVVLWWRWHCSFVKCYSGFAKIWGCCILEWIKVLHGDIFFISTFC